MSPLLECFGGPADGLRIRDDGGQFFFIEGEIRHARLGAVYQAIGHGTLEYVAERGMRCRSCEVVLVAPFPRCPLCGGKP